jgi:hypothetical protein
MPLADRGSRDAMQWLVNKLIERSLEAQIGTSDNLADTDSDTLGDADRHRPKRTGSYETAATSQKISGQGTLSR